MAQSVRKHGPSPNWTISGLKQVDNPGSTLARIFIIWKNELRQGRYAKFIQLDQIQYQSFMLDQQ